jgi:protein-tyrosine sulfotransferase
MSPNADRIGDSRAVARGQSPQVVLGEVEHPLIGLGEPVDATRGQSWMQRPLTAFKHHLIRNLRFLLLLTTARRELLFPRLVAVLSIVAFFVYLHSPYQLIPESVPVFGYADDVSILLIGFFVARRLTPTALYNLGDISGRPKARAIAISQAGAGFGDRAGDGFEEGAWTLYDLFGYRRAWQMQSLVHSERVSTLAPIVIGGCGRSGTTLLRTILNRHPKVFCGDESTVFLHRVSSARDISRRYGLDPDAVAGMFRESRSQVEFIERFGADCLRRSGKMIWAEKTPDNVLRFDFIRRHFPDAHIVQIVRDGRDVVCSLRRQKWFKVPEAERADIKAVEVATDYWMARVEAGLRFRGDPRYHELRYEDLVDNPQRTLQALFAALGLDWVESVLVPDPSAEVRHPHERKINADALGQWRRELSETETALIEQKAGSLLREFRYLG